MVGTQSARRTFERAKVVVVVVLARHQLVYQPSPFIFLFSLRGMALWIGGIRGGGIAHALRRYALIW